MIIKTEVLILKVIPAKNETITGIAQHSEISKFLTEKWMYPEGMPDAITFSVEFEGEIIGQAALKSIRWFNRKAELSLFIKPEYHGKSLGTQALEVIIKHAFMDMNLVRLEAEIIEYNKSAIAMAEKVGFVREGVLREAKYYNGKYFNIFRYGLLKREFRKSQKEDSSK